jgi:tRNA (adenine57-N1/adenine58-N1)-methyltransferase
MTDEAKRRRGPFAPGDLVQLTDPKGRQHTLALVAGKDFHTHRGVIAHDALIGQSEGVVVTSAGGTAYVAFRPLLSDYALSMPRGAAVVYPKDAAQIVQLADLYPGAHVVEAGAGSGALSCVLLRAVGDEGLVSSYEKRADFAAIARENVSRFFGSPPRTWRLTEGDIVAACDDSDADAVVLDMLAPWDVVETAAGALRPGGVICAYVATTTQLSRFVESVRAHGAFTEPAATESLLRGWHVEGLAVRPGHRMVGHTGFLVSSRRMAPGVSAPPRRRRPAKGSATDEP